MLLVGLVKSGPGSSGLLGTVAGLGKQRCVPVTVPSLAQPFPLQESVVGR